MRHQQPNGIDKMNNLTPSLQAKIKTVSKSNHHVVRILSCEEMNELDSVFCIGLNGWFNEGKRMIVAQFRAADEKFVLFAM